MALWCLIACYNNYQSFQFCSLKLNDIKIAQLQHLIQDPTLWRNNSTLTVSFRQQLSVCQYQVLEMLFVPLTEIPVLLVRNGRRPLRIYWSIFWLNFKILVGTKLHCSWLDLKHIQSNNGNSSKIVRQSGCFLSEKIHHKICTHHVFFTSSKLNILMFQGNYPFK